jgi:hypothetical protein
MSTVSSQGLSGGAESGQSPLSTVHIPVGRGHETVIDADSYRTPFVYSFRDGTSVTLRVCDRSWKLTAPSQWRYASCRVRAGGRDRIVLLHRLIVGALPGDIVDHISGNRLDNRKSNLRLAANWQNAANMEIRKDRGSSTFKGVHYDTSKGRWRASISFHGRKINLGAFASEHDAVIAYNTGAKLLFGGFARLNDIEVR